MIHKLCSYVTITIHKLPTTKYSRNVHLFSFIIMIWTCRGRQGNNRVYGNNDEYRHPQLQPTSQIHAHPWRSVLLLPSTASRNLDVGTCGGRGNGPARHCRRRAALLRLSLAGFSARGGRLWRGYSGAGGGGRSKCPASGLRTTGTFPNPR